MKWVRASMGVISALVLAECGGEMAGASSGGGGASSGGLGGAPAGSASGGAGADASPAPPSNPYPPPQCEEEELALITETVRQAAPCISAYLEVTGESEWSVTRASGDLAGDAVALQALQGLPVPECFRPGDRLFVETGQPGDALLMLHDAVGQCEGQCRTTERVFFFDDDGFIREVQTWQLPSEASDCYFELLGSQQFVCLRDPVEILPPRALDPGCEGERSPWRICLDEHTPSIEEAVTTPGLCFSGEIGVLGGAWLVEPSAQDEPGTTDAVLAALSDLEVPTCLGDARIEPFDWAPFFRASADCLGECADLPITFTFDSEGRVASTNMHATANQCLLDFIGDQIFTCADGDWVQEGFCFI